MDPPAGRRRIPGMRTASILAGTLLLLLAGCDRGGSSAAPEDPAPHATPAASRVDEAKRIAMSPPAGETPVDEMIRVLQAKPNPGKSGWWVNLGKAWVRKARESSDPGYYVNADACAEAALEIAPANPSAKGLKSLVLLNAHEFAAARDLAKATLAGDPDDVVALGALGDAELELGNFDAAVAATQKMVDLKPNLPSYSRAAWLAWLQGDVTRAKEIVRLAIDAGGEPADPEPLCWVLVQAAMIFWNEGDHAGAEAGFDLALTKFPDYPPALVGKARVASARGRHAQAAELLEAAWRASPLAETAWMLGDALDAAGRNADAQVAWANAQETARQSDRRVLAAFLATKNRDIDEAVRLAEAEAKVRGDIHTMDVLAWAYYRAGRFEEARTAIDAATRLGTQDAQILFHAGAIRIAQGQTAAGKKRIRQALELNPAFDLAGAAEARTLLAKKGTRARRTPAG